MFIKAYQNDLKRLVERFKKPYRKILKAFKRSELDSASKMLVWKVCTVVLALCSIAALENLYVHFTYELRVKKKGLPGEGKSLFSLYAMCAQIRTRI